MPLTPSRRTLAALTVAAALALASPGVAQALPSPDRVEPGSFVLQILAGPLEWAQSLFGSVWEATGSGLAPSGGSADGDNGSSLDPDGIRTNGDNGSGLDPDGRT